MITLVDISKSINKMIEGAVKDLFSYEVPIVAEELQEPIIRPSIKVIFDGISTGKFNSQYRERTLTCRVYFFAKNRYRPKIENMKIQETIENAFLEGIEIEPEFIVPIEKLEFKVSDSVLVCSLDINMIEILPDKDKSEIMENLEFTEKG